MPDIWKSPALLGNALLAGFLRCRLAQRSGRTTARQLALFLLLLSKSEQLGVLISVSLGLGNTSALQGLDASRALKDERRDETLDLRRLSLGLLLALSKLDWPSDNVLSDIIVFSKIEELTDLASSFWAQTTWDGGVGEAWDFSFSLLDNDKMEHGQIGVDNTSSDASAVALSSASRSVARMLCAEKKSDTAVGQHTLHHRESLLVVSTSDAEHVTLPFVSERISWNFLCHLFVEEDA